MNWPSGPAMIQEMQKRTDTVLLSFSCGKDAIATWLFLQGHFKIVPYYYYLIPGLRFVEESLAYYEDFFQTKIVRVPNPRLYEMLANHVFQTPQRSKTIETLNLESYSHDVLAATIMEYLNLPESTVVASGVRAADSPNRLATIRKYGPIRDNRSPTMVYPIWDWKKDQLVHEIRQAGVKLPVDYTLFGRSFDGIDLRFLYPLREHYPDDYQRILDWFPLAEAEIKRYEFNQQHKQEGWA